MSVRGSKGNIDVNAMCDMGDTIPEVEQGCRGDAGIHGMQLKDQGIGGEDTRQDAGRPGH